MRNLSILFLLLICLLLTGNSFAVSIEIENNITFTPITLNGNDQQSYAQMTRISTNDDRGGDPSWHVNIQTGGAAALTNSTYGNTLGPIWFDNTTGNTEVLFLFWWLPTSSLIVTPGPLNLSSPRKILSRPSGTNLNRYRYTPTSNQGLRVDVPSDALAGSYTGTMVVTFYDAP